MMADRKLHSKDLLSIQYIDGITLVDHKGKIVYSVRYNPRFDNESSEYEVLNKNFLEVYHIDKLEESTIYNCLKSGMPIVNQHQTFSDYKGTVLTTQNITIPIIRNGKVLGAIELSKDITTNEDVRRISSKYKEPINATLNGTFGNEYNFAQYTFDDIITRHQRFHQDIEKAKLIADSSSPILVYGETGTGKELFVQSIHNYSNRRDKPFIAQNCAAIPETLMETTFFGSVKGAYTEATDTPGIFEMADGGTLFLDEINSMPLNMQAKLLRVLQDGVIRRIGDVKYRKVNVRIVAAMNIDPLEALGKKLLRDDIFYRLSVINFKLLPLRVRSEDILPLSQHFISNYNIRFNKSVTAISKNVEALFLEYEWPGNVRELQHVIEAAMNITTTNTIGVNHLPIYISEKFTDLQDNPVTDSNSLSISVDNEQPLSEVVEQVEISMIKNALKVCKGNMSKASRLLKISRQTLQYKIDKYQINIEE